ncbi:MAG: hypothetical protein ABH803_02020 [Candidatus Micrarchaeota archaeon]
MKISFENTRLQENKIAETSVKLEKTIKKLEEIKKKRNWHSEYASILLPEEKKYLQESNALVKKHAKATALIVVGIGGSNLGTIAVSKAVGTKKTLFFADTVDPDYLNELLHEARKEKLLLNVITKSGSTTETIALLQFLIKELKIPANKVIATTSKGSKLEKLAIKEGFGVLYIPEKIGGRYSVFSNVGLFPLSFAGVNTKKLLEGARKASLKQAAKLAAVNYLFYKERKIIYNQFYFSKDLEALGKWYLQLFAESLGKNKLELIPTLSIGSIDLHSTIQAYLEGANNKNYRVVTTNFKEKMRIPENKNNDLVPGLQGREIGSVMHLIAQAFKKDLENNKKSFIEIELKEKSELEIGELMQLEMLEVILLAELLKVNAFNQPAVEGYKKELKKLLQKK